MRELVELLNGKRLPIAMLYDKKLSGLNAVVVHHREKSNFRR